MTGDGFNSHGVVLTKGRRYAHRAEEELDARAKNCRLTLYERTLLSWAVVERRIRERVFRRQQVMGVLGVVDVVSRSFPRLSREILEYGGLPNGASRLRADLPTPGCLRVGPRPPSSFFLSDRAGF